MFNRLLKNKKGDKLISAYWFVVLTLVAGGIFLMVNAFYNSPYDVREFESNILADKVIDCIYGTGELSPLVLGPEGKFKYSFQDNFEKICTLDFSPKNEWDPIENYIKVSFFENQKMISPKFEVYAGNQNYEEDCFFKEEHKELAECAIKYFYAISSDGVVFYIQVIAATAKVEQNV